MNAVQHQVDKVIVHPYATFFWNGVGLVRVAQPFRFTANVRAIRLPTEDTQIKTDGSTVPAILVGWGQSKVSESRLWSLELNRGKVLIAYNISGGKVGR